MSLWPQSHANPLARARLPLTVAGALADLGPIRDLGAAADLGRRGDIGGGMDERRVGCHRVGAAAGSAAGAAAWAPLRPAVSSRSRATAARDWPNGGPMTESSIFSAGTM